MKNTGFVSIILLNYNGKQFNKNCIDSILLQSYTNFEIIFVDNNSTDGSFEEVQNIFKNEIKNGKIKLLKNNDNLRFAGGNNSGVQAVSKESEYIWLLNNDTIIDKYCLEGLIKGIESDGKLGAVQSQILDKGQEKKIIEMMGKGMVPIMNAFGLQIWEKAGIRNNIYYTNFLCGCSFLYKRSVIEVPFFDFYKIYAEDHQLSREILLKGYKLGICKNATVYHFGSATMKKLPYTKLYLNTRNLMLNYRAFFGRHTRMKLFLPYLLFHFLQLISGCSNFRVLLKAKWNAFKRVRRNSDCVDIVKNRINDGRNLSENNFLGTMSSKMASDDFNSGKIKLLIIDIVNLLNRFHYFLFKIPHI